MTPRALALMALLALPFVAADAQRRGGRGSMQQYFGDATDFYTPPDFNGNHPYDGRVVFARIKYRGFECFMDQGPGWAHDYPRAESHLMRIMKSITSLRPFIEQAGVVGGNIVGLEDAELFKYPVAYLSEPGGWRPTLGEVQSLRKYLLKGGFLIVDDFEERCTGGGDMRNFTGVMRQVLPTGKLLEIPNEHPIFDSFFKVDLAVLGSGRRANARWFGYFQDNDPKKRIMDVANYMNDLGEMWEYSDRGFNPLPANEAYKLGVNYLIYALTH